MTDWSKEHPDAAKDIAVVGAGMAVLAKGASELALVIFLGSPLVKGVTALGAAAAGATGAITGLIAALDLIAKLGSDAETPQNRGRLDDLARQRRQGPGPTQDQHDSGIDDTTGLPFHRSAWRGGDITIHLDGDVTYRNNLRRAARDVERSPNTGGLIYYRLMPRFAT